MLSFFFFFKHLTVVQIQFQFCMRLWNLMIFSVVVCLWYPESSIAVQEDHLQSAIYLCISRMFHCIIIWSNPPPLPVYNVLPRLPSQPAHIHFLSPFPSSSLDLSNPFLLFHIFISTYPVVGFSFKMPLSFCHSISFPSSFNSWRRFFLLSSYSNKIPS